MDKQRSGNAKDDTFQLIDEMLRLMEDRGLVELEVEREGLKVRLKRGTPGVVHTAGPVLMPSAAAPAAPAAPVKEESKLNLIKSPMVGTFYRAPAPDASPFVEPGQMIELGQVVCIIEAMKLMNEIKAEVAGRVVDVMVKNGDAVEFGQPLFAIEPII